MSFIPYPGFDTPQRIAIMWGGEETTHKTCVDLVHPFRTNFPFRWKKCGFLSLSLRYGGRWGRGEEGCGWWWFRGHVAPTHSLTHSHSLSFCLSISLSSSLSLSHFFPLLLLNSYFLQQLPPTHLTPIALINYKITTQNWPLEDHKSTVISWLLLQVTCQVLALGVSHIFVIWCFLMAYKVSDLWIMPTKSYNWKVLIAAKG